MRRKTPDNQETATCLCRILDHTGSVTLKACISHKKAQEAQTRLRLLCDCKTRVRLTVG
jgi:hypothetical protein